MLFRLTRALLSLNRALFRLTGTLCRLNGVLFKLAGTLFRLTGVSVCILHLLHTTQYVHVTFKLFSMWHYCCGKIMKAECKALWKKMKPEQSKIFSPFIFPIVLQVHLTLLVILLYHQHFPAEIARKYN